MSRERDVLLWAASCGPLHGMCKDSPPCAREAWATMDVGLYGDKLSAVLESAAYAWSDGPGAGLETTELCG